MIDRKQILGFNVVNGTYSDLKSEFSRVLNTNSKIRIFAFNPEKFMISREDSSIKDILMQAELLIPDGIGIIKAAKLYGTPLLQRLTGVDTFTMIMEYAVDNDKSVFFYGATQTVLENTINNISSKYSSKIIAGSINGFCESEKAVEAINESNADFLVVALGSPKQEYFINDNFKRLNVNIMQGVGGTFDVISGKVRRAPHLVQKLNLEWLHRLFLNPKRIFRQARLIKFIKFVRQDTKKNKGVI